MEAENQASERFLEQILQAGVTYIADRGYPSFEIINKVITAQAFCIFRIKENLLYEVSEKLAIVKADLPVCFRRVRDELVIFKSDKHQRKVRLIQFEVAQSKFSLVTNRFDLTTLEVIILYAYRWQIELFFKYLKRTLKGLHLFNHSQKRCRDTVLSVANIGIIDAEIQTRLPKQEIAEKQSENRKKEAKTEVEKSEKRRVSGEEMDQENY